MSGTRWGELVPPGLVQETAAEVRQAESADPAREIISILMPRPPLLSSSLGLEKCLCLGKEKEGTEKVDERESERVSVLETKSVHLDFPREVFIQCPTVRKKNHLTCWLSSKEPPLPMQEIQVQSLGQEDSLEKEMATHSSILAWEIPWIEEPGGLQSMGVAKSWTRRLNNNIIFVDTGKHLINFTVHLQLKNLGNLRIERNFLNLKKRHLPENYSKHHRKTLETLP